MKTGENKIQYYVCTLLSYMLCSVTRSLSIQDYSESAFYNNCTYYSAKYGLPLNVKEKVGTSYNR